MELEILKTLGLTNDQIKTYRILLENGPLSPPQLAELSGESRTNAYMALKKLAEVGLAERDPSNKKLTYAPLSPAHLGNLIDKQERELQIARSELQSQLPNLLNIYYNNVEKPTTRYFEGREALQKVYQDQIATGEDVYVIQTPEDIDKSLVEDIANAYIEKLAEVGIDTFGLAPNYPANVAWTKKNGKRLRRKITWYDPEQYSAPVELAIYGNKVAFIVFGETITAAIIDSPQIAGAMRDLFKMAQGGAKSRRFL